MAFEDEGWDGPGGMGGGGGSGANMGAGEAIVKGIGNVAKAIGRGVKDAFGPKVSAPVSKSLGQLRGPMTTAGGRSTGADMRTAGEATQRGNGGVKPPTAFQSKMADARGSAALNKASAGLNRRITGGAVAGGAAAAAASQTHAAKSAVAKAAAGAPHTSSTGAVPHGASAAESGHPVHTPVSHPGTGKPPIKAATGNRGHATVHPPKPATSHAAPARHTRPAHATGKATAGTQHTNSSGTKAGHPAAKKAKKTKTKKKVK